MLQHVCDKCHANNDKKIILNRALSTYSKLISFAGETEEEYGIFQKPTRLNIFRTTERVYYIFFNVKSSFMLDFAILSIPDLLNFLKLLPLDWLWALAMLLQRY